MMAALSATLIIFSSQILTDTLFLFFFSLMLLAGAHFLLRPTRSLALLAGLAGGLALATRVGIAPLLIAAVPLIFIVASWRWRSYRRGFVAALVFTIAAAAPITPLLLRNALAYGSFDLTTQTGDHLAFWIVPLVAERADGTPFDASVARMQALYRQRLADSGLNEKSNPFLLSGLKGKLAREEMARLPLAAFVKSWLEGMVVNLAAPALLADPRVRALPKPSFYNTPGTTLWERAKTYLFDRPGDSIRCCSPQGLQQCCPSCCCKPAGFVHAGAPIAVGRRLRRRVAHLFSPAQRTGGDAEIPHAHGAGADRARGHSLGAVAERYARPRAPANYLIRSRMLT